MLFLDGVYVERPDGSLAFRWVKAPTGAELSALASSIAERVGRFLERQGLLEGDAQSTCLSDLALEGEPMEALAFALDHLPHRGGAARRAQGVHAAEPAGWR